jgi:hypothetical protein
LPGSIFSVIDIMLSSTSQKSEVRNQKSEVRGQKSEIRGQLRSISDF